MIKLSDLLLEFDYGQYPFTDPRDPSIQNPDTIRHLAKSYKEEPNTPEETVFLNKLSQYINVHSDTLNLHDLKFLQKVKERFPNILKPNTSVEGGLVYRGATINAETILDPNIKIVSENRDRIKVVGVNKATSRSKTGYLSFSTSFNIANDFSSYGVSDTLLKDRLPAIYGISAKDPNLLFNNEFMNAISDVGEEDEVFYLDTTFTPEVVYLPLNRSIYRYYENPPNGVSNIVREALVKILKL